MRLILCALCLHLLCAMLWAQEAKLVAEAFVPMGRTARAEAVVVEGAPVVRLPCNFAGTQISRASWDLPWQVDLSASSAVEIEMRCEDPAPVGGFSVYFQTGDGWYASGISIEPGKWQRVRIPLHDTRIEGKPAGWSKVRTIRISAWRGLDRDTEILIRAIRPEYTDGAVGVLRAEADGEGGVAEYTSRVCTILEGLGVKYRLLSDADLSAETLGAVKILVMPHTPSLAASAERTIADWLKSGGKAVAFFQVPDQIAAAGGLRMVGFRKAGVAGEFSAIVPERAFNGAPAAVQQRSWNIIESAPGGEDALVLARWHDEAGQPGAAAIVGSPRLIHMSHVLLSQDTAAGNLLLAMIGRLEPTVWQEAARVTIEGLEKEYVDLAPGTEPGAKAALAKAMEEFSRSQGLLASAQYPAAIAAASVGRDLVVEAFALEQQPKPGEFRAFWSHRANGIDGESWDVSLKHLADNGFTAIIPNMLWGGVAYYPSRHLPQAPEVQAGRDYIAECVAAAKKHGLEVHVWKVNWNMGWAVPADFVEKMRSSGRTQVMFDGKPQERWLCPSHPDNQQLEIDSMVEVATNYEVDGVHFDYIRYPGPEGCFCAGCRERFEKSLGATVADWPADTRGNPEMREKWLQFRRDQITRVVSEVRERLRGRPQVKISAAVFPNWTSARDDVGQDWKLWCERGYVDFICPMDYTQGNGQFRQYVINQLQWAGKVPAYPGIGLSTWNGSREDFRRLIEQIRIAREQGAPGFTIFEYDKSAAQRVVPLLGQGITRK